MRANYLLHGAIWTNGKIPGVDSGVTLIGSTALANTTMETYKQNLHCFSCHQGGGLDGLSHIYKALLPLP